MRASRVGTGSFKLLSTLTDMFIAAKKHWEAATSNSPVLSSKNDDSAARQGLETVGWCTCFGFNRGDVSSGIDGPSLAGKPELNDEAYGAVDWDT